MKLHVARLRVSKNLFGRGGRTVALIAHDGQQARIRAVGYDEKTASVDLGGFRARCPEHAASDWVYAEWVEWLLALVIESADQLHKFLDLMRSERAHRHGYFRLSPISQIETEDAPGVALDRIFKQSVPRWYSWAAEPLSRSLNRLFAAADIDALDGFRRDVEVRLMSGPARGARLRFDGFVDGPKQKRIAVIGLNSWAHHRAVRASHRAATKTLETSIKSGLVLPHRCVLVRDDVQRRLGLRRTFFRTTLGFEILDLGDERTAEYLRKLCAT